MCSGITTALKAVLLAAKAQLVQPVVGHGKAAASEMGLAVTAVLASTASAAAAVAETLTVAQQHEAGGLLAVRMVLTALMVMPLPLIPVVAVAALLGVPAEPSTVARVVLVTCV
jgi:hypothetical protein